MIIHISMSPDETSHLLQETKGNHAKKLNQEAEKLTDVVNEPRAPQPRAVLSVARARTGAVADFSKARGTQKVDQT